MKQADVRGRRGAALIIVLVTLLSLVGLVVAGSRHTLDQAVDLAALRDEYQADLLAESALAVALDMLAKDARPEMDSPEEPWAVTVSRADALIKIDPCDMRLNLNLAPTHNRTRDALEELVEKKGMQQRDFHLLLDWIDRDKRERYPGSERSLYEDKLPEYKPHNNRLMVTEELYLVRGWEEADPEWVADHFTVWDSSGRININFVEEAVFKAFFPEIAGEWTTIRSWRESRGFTDVSELREASQLLSADDALYTDIIKYLRVDSQYYRVMIEVQTPMVYAKRRYIVRREKNEPNQRPEVLRCDVLAVLPSAQSS